MTEAFENVAAVALQDNEVHFFYRLNPVSLERGPEIAFKHVMCAAKDGQKSGVHVFPKDQQKVLEERYGDTAIWQKAGGKNAPKPWPVTKDLSPRINDILTGKRPELATQWMLGPLAGRVLKSADLNAEGVDAKAAPKVLVVTHSKAAEKRLEAAGITPSPLVITLEGMAITAFVTGDAFCTLRIRFRRTDQENLTAMELSEAVAALARFNKCRWVDASTFEDVEGHEFSLGSLVRVLSAGCAERGTKERRVETYTFAQTATHIPTEQTEALSAFLARHYTSAYDLDMEQADLTLVRDFRNLRHAVSLEGVSSVMVPDVEGNLVSFLKDWKNSVFRSAYSPLVLLGLHEHRYLTAGRSKALEAQTQDENLHAFQAILDDTLVFRLNLRFPHVSRVSLHNQFNTKFRDVLELDKKLAELEGDVKTISQRLNAAQREQDEVAHINRHRRIFRISAIGSASLAGLTAYTIAKETLGVVTELEKHQVGQYSVAFGLFIILFTYIFSLITRPRKPEGGHAGHFGKHTMYEHMIKRALKSDG